MESDIDRYKDLMLKKHRIEKAILYGGNDVDSSYLREKLWYYTLKYDFQDIIECNYEHDHKNFNLLPPNNVFCLWYQGVDRAPNIVKKCIQSVKYHLKNYNILILDKNNLFDYIDVPDYIMKKMESGIIKQTHFSDIIRVMLLAKYGGIWIDSTVLMTDSYFVLNVVNRYPFFAFRMEAGQFRKIDPWLMACCKDHIFLQRLKDLLLAYWEKYDFQCHYFLITILFNIVTEIEREEWEKMPKFYAHGCLTMQRFYFKEYSEDLFRALVRFSDIHKLTYKFDNLPQAKDENTVYKHIVNMDIAKISRYF